MTFLYPSQNTSDKQFEKTSDSSANNALAGISPAVSTIVLKTLQDIARSPPVPCLSDISSVALEILQAVQTSRGHKEEFKELGTDTCGLVYAINATCQGLVNDGKSLSTDLEENLKQLLSSIMKQIRDFIAQQSRRNRFSCLLTYKSDSEAIQKYRDGLKHSLDIFGFQSGITIRELVARMAEQQQADRGRSTSNEASKASDHRGAGSGGSNFDTTFPDFNSASFSGSIRVNNVAGNQHNSSNETHYFTTNSFNDSNYADGHCIGR
ncbi:hypothetical protein PQX77_002595 [Marasmius sp. AFHP31]|nr:hypothetical protein PQX77_002595 [Marasmius sp. AFHP31]